MEHWSQKCDGAGCPAEYIAVCRERDELKKELDKVTKALDAAVKDMKCMLDNCKACIHEHDAPEDCDCECVECKKKCPCGACIEGSKFEWRGAREEQMT